MTLFDSDRETDDDPYKMEIGQEPRIQVDNQNDELLVRFTLAAVDPVTGQRVLIALRVGDWDLVHEGEEAINMRDSLRRSLHIDYLSIRPLIKSEEPAAPEPASPVVEDASPFSGFIDEYGAVREARRLSAQIGGLIGSGMDAFDRFDMPRLAGVLVRIDKLLTGPGAALYRQAEARRWETVVKTLTKIEGTYDTWRSEMLNLLTPTKREELNELRRTLGQETGAEPKLEAPEAPKAPQAES